MNIARIFCLNISEVDRFLAEISQVKVLLKIEIQVFLRKDVCRRQQNKSFVVSRFVFGLNPQGDGDSWKCY